MELTQIGWSGGQKGRARPLLSAPDPEAIASATGLLSDLRNRLEDQDLIRLATLGLMTAGVAHDLGNLLQIVSSAVRLIDQKLDPATRAELAPLTAGAMESVNRAGALSRQILDLSRSKAAVEEITCLERTLGSIRNLVVLMAGPRVAVEFAMPGDLPQIVCNTRELENAILNLVINARDAMPEGGRLTISTFSETEAPDYDRFVTSGGITAVLSVRDTGCGMSPDLASKVFKPFFTTKSDSSGTGLGLSMVSDFARRAGGCAEIESAPGRGTTVTLRLPGCAG